MDFVSLYYFLEAGKSLNFTKSAQKMFISQQNLSKHIKNLEKYYQAQLFERKPQLKLTDAGEALMKFAESVFSEERAIKNILSDISHQRRGTIRIGASAPRSRIFMTELLKIFAPEYPLVQIELVNSTSSDLEKMVEAGQLDFAIGIFPDPSPQLICQNVLRDHIYLTAADSLLYRCLGENAAALKEKGANGLQMSDIVALPLIFPSDSNRISHTLSRLLQKCSSQTIGDLNIYMYTTYPQFYFNICIDGLAAAFMTQMSLLDIISKIGTPMNFFPLFDGQVPAYHRISILYSATERQPEYKKRFLYLLQNYFAKVEQLRLLQKP